jgi:hypothetical protein
VAPAACAAGAAHGGARTGKEDSSDSPPFLAPSTVTTSLPLGNRRQAPRGPLSGAHDSYLVDSASSHMLVSKIKPCKSKFKQLNGETANGSLNQLSYI